MGKETKENQAPTAYERVQKPEILELEQRMLANLTVGSSVSIEAIQTSE